MTGRHSVQLSQGSCMQLHGELQEKSRQLQDAKAEICSLRSQIAEARASSCNIDLRASRVDIVELEQRHKEDVQFLEEQLAAARQEHEKTRWLLVEEQKRFADKIAEMGGPASENFSVGTCTALHSMLLVIFSLCVCREYFDYLLLLLLLQSFNTHSTIGSFQKLGLFRILFVYLLKSITRAPIHKMPSATKGSVAPAPIT